MKAVGYVRVSTTEQAEEGLSLDAQEHKIRAYCELRGLELVGIIRDEGVSARRSLASRAGGDLLEQSVDGDPDVGAVVAYRLDRLFRNTADCLHTVCAWDRRGLTLHLVDMGGQTLDTSSAMGRFFLTMMAALAELESGWISERTIAGMEQKVARGESTGRVPFGYQLADDGRELLPDAEEQKWLRHPYAIQRVFARKCA